MKNDIEEKGGKSIIIADGIPSYNRGEEAILLGICRSLREAKFPVSEIVLCSDDVKEDGIRYKGFVRTVQSQTNNGKARSVRGLQLVISGLLERINLKLAKRIFSGTLWEEYQKADLILYGHDNLLAGGGHPSIWFLANAFYGFITGKPKAIVAGSIGPYKKGYGVYLGRLLLNMTDLITIRDPMSYQYCSHLNLKHKNYFLTGDTAFLLEPSSPQKARSTLEDSGIPLDRRIIGITAVRTSGVFKHAFELMDEGKVGITEEQKDTKHVKELGKALDLVIEQLGVSIVFVPHCIGEGLLDDRRVASRVRAEMVHKESVWLLQEEFSASDLKAIMGQFDFFIGERTHSVIGALSMNVPSIAISYPTDYRTYGIVGEMVGIPDHLYDIRELNAKSLMDKIIECWEKRQNTRDHLMKVIPQIQNDAAQFGIMLRQIIRD